MKKQTPDISGIKITAYKVNEALINCKISLSFSDAMDLCKKTESGLYIKQDFHDWFIAKLTEKLQEAIDTKNGSES